MSNRKKKQKMVKKKEIIKTYHKEKMEIMVKMVNVVTLVEIY